MQYLISVHHGATTDGDFQLSLPEGVQPEDLFAAVGAFNDEVQAAGAWVFAGGLMPPKDGALVDGTGVDAVVVDGPHAETKEHLGGFWVLEAENREAALEWARKASAACQQAVQVRPFQG